MSAPSVNREAVKIVKEVCVNQERYGVIVKKSGLGAYVIDAGINAKGGFLIGEVVTRICLGGLGEARISSITLDDVKLPSTTVFTDHPSISTLGSQLAGWRINLGKYMAIGSGPARALVRKPKSIYEKIKYRDDADEAVLVLETFEEPTEEVIRMISEACHISPGNLYLILVPTTSIAGLIQISGRVVETGIYRLLELGFDPNVISYAWGQAPILPTHPDSVEAMGRANDAILYGGVTYCIVNHDCDEYLQSLIKKAISSASKDYGRPFAEIFRAAGQDFYKIDPQIFAPATMILINAKTGKTFKAGRVNADALFRSMHISF